jgi:hypothetical protein
MKTVRKTNKAICKKYGITDNTLQAWIGEGIDIHDDAAMAERVARKHGAAGTEMYQARLKKLQAEAISAQLKADELAGKLIAIDEVEACFVRIGNVTKSLLIRMQADLPPALEGQTPSRMQAIIAQAVASILTQMSDSEMQHWKH